MRLVILIPAYNESDTVGHLIDSIPSAIDGISEIIPVVIDDGSDDDTAPAASRSGATVVSHARNQGLADAFRTAVRTALELHADIAVSIDADLQFSPDEIEHLVQPILAREADFVVGNRFADTKSPTNMDRIKYHGNRLMTRLVNLITGERFEDVSSGFRAYSREALLNLNVQSSFTYTQESFIELAAKGLSIKQVAVTVRYFPERRSRVVTSIGRYALRTFLTIARTTRDYAPLTIFGWMAALITAPGFAIGIFVIVHYLLTGSFSPYIFLAFASAYLITFGTALFILGLVADMLRGTRANQERMLYFAKLNHYSAQRTDRMRASSSTDVDR